jgi:hypothetical protein
MIRVLAIMNLNADLPIGVGASDVGKCASDKTPATIDEAVASSTISSAITKRKPDSSGDRTTKTDTAGN